MNDANAQKTNTEIEKRQRPKGQTKTHKTKRANCTKKKHYLNYTIKKQLNFIAALTCSKLLVVNIQLRLNFSTGIKNVV